MPLELDKERYAWGALRLEVLKRDKWRCGYCNTRLTNETANIDHIKPWQNGGRTRAGNLISCCRDCNRTKLNEKWKPLRATKRQNLSPGQRRRRREHKEELAWQRRNGPVTVVHAPLDSAQDEPGQEPSTG